jgi:anti-sigma regulatory factor (Ser/Thr protein kinase)
MIAASFPGSAEKGLGFAVIQRCVAEFKLEVHVMNKLNQ